MAEKKKSWVSQACNIYDRLLQFFLRLPKWILVFSSCILTAAILIGWLTNFNIPVENTTTILNTLASVQATVLAIVFSITILGTQILATSYSSRMISFFIKTPHFKFAFGLFIGSIAFDFILLYFRHYTFADFSTPTGGLNLSIPELD